MLRIVGEMRRSPYTNPPPIHHVIIMGIITIVSVEGNAKVVTTVGNSIIINQIVATTTK